MKRQPLWIAGILFFSLACGIFTAPVPAPTAAAPIIVEVTPTNSPFAPEEANAGSHHYWMSPNEDGCPASDSLKTPQFRDKELNFAPDFNSVIYSDRSYSRVGEHRYQSINESEKPLVLIFSEHGFVLFVYHPDANPDIAEACLTFSFTLAD